MNILVGNYNFNNTGGSDNYAYAVITELLRLGHDVEYYTFNKGFISDKIEKLGVKFMSRQHYDLIIANHKPVILRLFKYGYIIQTTHGILPGIDEPSVFADYNVCVSEFQQKYYSEKNIKLDLILNGIDCGRFYPKKPVNDRLTNVLSLCQSENANRFIASCCKKLGVAFRKRTKNKDNTWYIEDEINKADLVVGVGRSLYDAMACGRTVISYDTRYADRNFEGDGYLNQDNIKESLKYNCCGGFKRLFFTPEDFITELEKYDGKDGIYLREFDHNELNISKSVKMYLDIYEKNITGHSKDGKILQCSGDINFTIDNFLKDIENLKLLTRPVRNIVRLIVKFVNKYF
jgi:glycosyltransferase involved in cell wall biosynthesis